MRPYAPNTALAAGAGMSFFDGSFCGSLQPKKFSPGSFAFFSFFLLGCGLLQHLRTQGWSIVRCQRAWSVFFFDDACWLSLRTGFYLRDRRLVVVVSWTQTALPLQLRRIPRLKLLLDQPGVLLVPPGQTSATAKAVHLTNFLPPRRQCSAHHWASCDNGSSRSRGVPGSRLQSITVDYSRLQSITVNYSQLQSITVNYLVSCLHTYQGFQAKRVTLPRLVGILPGDYGCIGGALIRHED
jgi:hypothetical protein